MRPLDSDSLMPSASLLAIFSPSCVYSSSSLWNCSRSAAFRPRFARSHRSMMPCILSARRPCISRFLLSYTESPKPIRLVSVVVRTYCARPSPPPAERASPSGFPREFSPVRLSVARDASLHPGAGHVARCETITHLASWCGSQLETRCHPRDGFAGKRDNLADVSLCWLSQIARLIRQQCKHILRPFGLNTHLAAIDRCHSHCCKQ